VFLQNYPLTYQCTIPTYIPILPRNTAIIITGTIQVSALFNNHFITDQKQWQRRRKVMYEIRCKQTDEITVKQEYGFNNKKQEQDSKYIVKQCVCVCVCKTKESSHTK
jgi:hypothetical protein